MQVNKIFKRIKNKKKDLQINKNIKKFIEKKKNFKIIPKRENNFKQEIIIPCYNHGRFIESGIKNIPKNIAVTIVNDASTDNTLEILTNLKNKYNFKLINNKKNLNQIGSLNKAIKKSKNNLFTVLNADDVLFKYQPNIVLNIFKKYKNIRMCGAGCIPFNNDSFLLINEYLPEKAKHKINHVELIESEKTLTYNHPNSINMTMSGCTFLKSAWEFVGGFYEFENRVVSFDDRDFQIRVNAFFDVLLIHEPLTFYRTNSSTQRSQNV